MPDELDSIKKWVTQKLSGIGYPESDPVFNAWLESPSDINFNSRSISGVSELNGVSTGSGYYKYIMYGERSVLSNGVSTYMGMGNGQTPLGVTMMSSGRISGISTVTSNSVGTSANLYIYKNGVSTGISCAFLASLNEGNYKSASEGDFTPISFQAGDVIGLYVSDIVGSWAECIGGVELEFNLSGLKGDRGDSTIGAVPIGASIAWNKSLTNTPALTDEFVEMNGQVLSDAESVYNGQTIPNANGYGGQTQRFFRGCTTSGATGGSDTSSAYLISCYACCSLTSCGGSSLPYTMPFSILPSYYTVVWIMRIK